jgi:serine/threonine protein kinase
MEYVEGMDLDQHIKVVTGPISEPKAIEIMSTLLDAFGYAHEKGIVHRDIKPANFIITPDGKVKVLDFGIAKIVDENASGKTLTGTRIGTVAYMSPEQVNAAPDIDLRTDIYSLGVLLHQMITGKPAYDTTTSSDFEVQTRIVKEPLPRANTIYPYTSDHLQTLIDKATQKKR